MTDEAIWADLDIRITDQRIGVGIGGYNTILRMQHIPTGIVVELPRGLDGGWKRRQLAKDMIEYALAEWHE